MAEGTGEGDGAGAGQDVIGDLADGPGLRIGSEAGLLLREAMDLFEVGEAAFDDTGPQIEPAVLLALAKKVAGDPPSFV